MSLFLGIDLGTSYFKIGLFDEAGSLRGLGRVAVDKLSPAPGRSEVPAAEFWRLLRRGLDEALAQAGAPARDIAALSYSSQANSFLLLDHRDQPLTPLILWTDDRANPVDESWRSFARSEAFVNHIGREGISGNAAVAKWRWFEKNQPELWARVRHIMTISDYFTFGLTGERVGDASTAAMMGLYDLAGGGWWKESLATFGVDPGKLSRPLLPGTSHGRTSAKATELLGLRPGMAYAVGGLDHHIAAVGSGLGRFADMSISTGTVLAALALVSRPQPKPGCCHGPHVDGRRFYRLAVDANGAGQLEDFQRLHAPQSSIEELLAQAALVAPGVTEKDAAASIGAGVRYVLEKIAATHRRLAATASEPGTVRSVVATGGGARSPLWLQIKADMMGLPIVTSSCTERACLGAAAMAAAAAGIHRSLDEATLAMVHPAALPQFEIGQALADPNGLILQPLANTRIADG